MVNGVGPTDLTYTIQYAADGLNFSKYADISTDEPGAPGLFRWELTDPSLGCRPDWGVYGTRQIGRYEIDFPASEVSFPSSSVTGFPDDGLIRRDPSDVIQVGDTWHMWFTRSTIKHTGDGADIWHATSTDEGCTWTEQAEAVARGSDSTNNWDYTSALTPNILFHEGTYYLYYTGTPLDWEDIYIAEGIKAIGVATASSPYGPWTKYAGNPVLRTSSVDSGKFDNYLIDDACMAVRDGNIWLYYKGRYRGSSATDTQMGVAVASDPLGPFIKQNDGDPVQEGGHEVQIWADRYQGIYSQVNSVGSSDLTYTIQYAADGLNFRKYADTSTDIPGAPGLFRPELTDPDTGQMPSWGIEGITYIGRFEVDYNDSGALRMQLVPASIIEGNRMGDWIGDLNVTGGSGYAFELLPIINTNDFLVGSTSVAANTVFDSSVTNQVGLFIRATAEDSTIDAYFDVDVLDASGVRRWRLDAFGADVLAQTNLESSVWGDEANPDGDAFSNVEEYAADTDAQDSNSVLRVESLIVDGSTLELSWIGGVLATQYVESCTALTSNTAWTVVATNLPPTAVSNVWNSPVPVETPSALFRIKAVR
jgi:hypothetical protein